MPGFKRDIVAQLQKDILLWEGFKPPSAGAVSIFGLGEIEEAFPNAVFPTGTVHEFVNAEPEHAAACNGFIAGLLQPLMKNGGACLWVGTSRKLFPPALGIFGIAPERIIFADLKREKDVLWAAEEGLKCKGLAAVIAEVREISFAESRRLQLAVEQSKVTGFILRTDPCKLSATACAARWRITPVASETEDNMPGVGFPRWKVELLKVRNGQPGNWQIEWMEGKFNPVIDTIEEEELLQIRNAG
jgi:protein ImuA